MCDVKQALASATSEIMQLMTKAETLMLLLGKFEENTKKGLTYKQYCAYCCTELRYSPFLEEAVANRFSLQKSILKSKVKALEGYLAEKSFVKRAKRMFPCCSSVGRLFASRVSRRQTKRKYRTRQCSRKQKKNSTS